MVRVAHHLSHALNESISLHISLPWKDHPHSAFYFLTSCNSLQVYKNDVYAGSQDGELGVWQLDPNRKTLITKYILETESVPQLSLRQLSAVVEHKGRCYLGDGGPNIKVLEWKKSKNA